MYLEFQQFEINPSMKCYFKHFKITFDLKDMSHTGSISFNMECINLSIPNSDNETINSSDFLGFIEPARENNIRKKQLVFVCSFKLGSPYSIQEIIRVDENSACILVNSDSLDSLPKCVRVEKSPDNKFVKVGHDTVLPVSDIDGVILRGDQSLIFSDWNTSAIKLMAGEAVTTLVSTEPLHPYGLCAAINEGFFVCLNEHDPTDEVNKKTFKSRRSVTRYSDDGQLIMSYDPLGPGGEHLFQCPIGVVQGKDGDILVIDRENKDKGRVYDFSFAFEFRFKYDGIDKFDTFDPLKTCFDSEGSVLITDFVNNCIHMLDSQGLFLQLFLADDDSISHPWSLVAFGHKLWLSHDTNKVTVYEYATS